jgi:hypothetical protein
LQVDPGDKQVFVDLAGLVANINAQQRMKSVVGPVFNQ